MPTLKTTIGMNFGFLDPKSGKLLVKQRVSEEQTFRGNWDMPGGGVEEVGTSQVRYDHPILEAVREADEEVGIRLPLMGMPPVHLTLFKNRQGEYDLAGVIPYVTDKKPTRGITMWVSPKELETLAAEFVSERDARKQGLSEAKGLVSGLGKRMHCLCLRSLMCSPNASYVAQATKMLEAIQASW